MDLWHSYGDERLRSEAKLVRGEWHHIALEIGPPTSTQGVGITQSFTLYVDGKEQAQADWLPAQEQYSILKLGYPNPSNISAPLEGALDEIGLYKSGEGCMTAADLYRREGIPTFVDERIVDFSHTTLVWYSLTSPREVAARSVRFFSSMAMTRRFLREHSPDLVHLNSSTLASCAIAAKREGIPVVWHIREPLSRGHLSLRQTLLRRAIHRYADRVVAIGNHEADQLIRDDRVRVIYNFVDFTLFDRALSGENFREEMGARSETRLVGMLGGVSRVKGTKEFVEALPFVRRALPEVKFIVLGGLPDPRARRRPGSCWREAPG